MYWIMGHVDVISCELACQKHDGTPSNFISGKYCHLEFSSALRREILKVSLAYNWTTWNRWITLFQKYWSVAVDIFLLFLTTHNPPWVDTLPEGLLYL